MKYPTAQEGDWFRPKMKGFKFMCCDCRLVHTMDFKVIRWGKGHKVIFRIFRNNRATSAARRK